MKKLVQYAKYGRCSRDTPYPPEVNWIKLRVDERKAVRVSPKGFATHFTNNFMKQALVFRYFWHGCYSLCKSYGLFGTNSFAGYTPVNTFVRIDHQCLAVFEFKNAVGQN